VQKEERARSSIAAELGVKEEECRLLANLVSVHWKQQPVGVDM
jgi:hypothetical protein